MIDIINDINKYINNNNIGIKLPFSEYDVFPYYINTYSNDYIFILNLNNVILNYNNFNNVIFSLNKYENLIDLHIKGLYFNNNYYNIIDFNNIYISKKYKKIIFIGFRKNIKNFIDTDLLKFFNNINNLFKKDIKCYNFTECYEGFQINVYYYNNEWVISTKNKINAEESKWRSHKNFKEIFIQLLEIKFNNINIFFNKLNKNYSYIFLVKSHHILKLFDIYQKDDNIYHLMTRNMIEKNFPIVYDNLGMDIPKSMVFNNKDDLYNNITNNIDMNTKKIQGYYCQELNLKIYYPKYLEFKDLLLISSNTDYVMIYLIFYHYDKINYILNNYNKYVDIYNNFIIIFNKFLKYLHKIYSIRFVKKNYNNSINNKYHFLIRYIHAIYLLNKNNNNNYKMNLDNLVNIFFNYNKYNNLNIKFFINSKSTHKAFNYYKNTIFNNNS